MTCFHGQEDCWRCEAFIRFWNSVQIDWRMTLAFLIPFYLMMWLMR